MSDKPNWRAIVLEDGLIVIALLGLGVTVAALKLMPVLLRWSRSGR